MVPTANNSKSKIISFLSKARFFGFSVRKKLQAHNRVRSWVTKRKHHFYWSDVVRMVKSVQ